MTLESPTHAVVRGFLGGGLAALASSLVLPSVFQAANLASAFPRAASTVLWELPIPLSLAIGGLIAGRALDAGRRGTTATGLSMLVAGAIQGLVAIEAGRLTGREDPAVVVATLISTGVGSFAAGGACAGVLLGVRPRLMGQMVRGFAGAGFLESVPGIAAFFLARLGAGAVLGPAFPFLLLLLQAASILAPFIVAGVVLARVLENGPNQKPFDARRESSA
jgi:hypothetical protein